VLVRPRPAAPAAAGGQAHIDLDQELRFRLRKRFGTWLAPAIAFAVMAAAFAVSSLVIGPAISGE
jgi:hypothetical protein